MSEFKEGQVVYTLLIPGKSLSTNALNFDFNDDIKILKGIVRSHETISNADPEQREVYGIEDENGKGHMRYECSIFGSLQELKEYVEKDILDIMREINKACTRCKKELDYTTKHFRQWKGLLDTWYETCAIEDKKNNS